MEIIRLESVSEDIVKSFKKLIPQLNDSVSVPSKRDLEDLLNSPNTFIFMAKKNQEVVGTLTLLLNKMLTGKKAIIEDVVVDRSERNRGIGRLMVQHAIGFAKEHGFRTIELTSRPDRIEANKLYTDLGFKQRNTNNYRLQLD